jgi:hypothetical protein
MNRLFGRLVVWGHPVQIPDRCISPREVHDELSSLDWVASAALHLKTKIDSIDLIFIDFFK